MATKEFYIVGAGLVGSLWAYLLKKQGFSVHVYEKRSDPRGQTNQSGRSINLIVTSRGLNGLKQAGLGQDILAITVPVHGRLMHGLDGATNYQAYGRNNTECNYAVSRADLNKKLIEKCAELGVSFHFNHELTDIDIENKRLQFNGSTSVPYQCVFSTDGAGSLIRKKLEARNSQSYQESVSYLTSDYKELYLPCDSSSKPRLEKNSLHIWPRGSHMLMALANQDNSFTLTLYLPKTNHKWSFDTLNTKDRVSQLFQSEFKDTINLIPDYQTQFLENPQGSLGTVRFSKWHFDDSIALLGDAAHAIVPFFGQGMNSGFEDVTNLFELLETSNWDLESSFSKYSHGRIPNTNAIADMALENFVEMSEKVGDQNFLLQKKIESVLEREFPDQYRSRYGMITYTLIPYLLAQQAGVIQARLLSSLAAKCKKIEDLTLEDCKNQMQKEWIPWLEKQKLNLSRFVV